MVETHHDFGALDRGEKLTHAFAVRNDGEARLGILRVDLSQPGMRSRFKSVVPPGETAQIVVEWDTTRFSGDVSAEAVVHFSDPARPRVTLTLTGVIRRPVDILPSPDLFFSLFRDEAAERHVTVVNNEEQPLQIRGLRREGDRFTADVSAVQPGRTFDVSIAIPPGLPAGRYTDVLYVDTDHPRFAQLRIGVNVFIKNDLYASPEVVDLKEVSLTQARQPSAAALLTHTSMIRKREGEFAITSISSDVPGLRIHQTPSERSNSFRLDVQPDPERIQPGPLDGSITIATDDVDFPTIVLPVRGVVR